MTYAIERIFDEAYARGYAKGIEKGKREEGKALIGLLDYRKKIT